MNRTLSKAVLTIVFSLAAASANAAYTFSLLDGLGGNLSEIRDINNSGQIVGWSNNRATLWNGGVVTDLGTTFAGGFNCVSFCYRSQVYCVMNW